MNPFDITVAVALVAFMGFGFRAGLLRSLASIFGYVAAAPVAVAATSWVSPALASDAAPPWTRNFMLFFVVLFVVGAAVGHLLRQGLATVAGDDVDIVDRIVGAIFGAVRVGLVVLPVVVAFDRFVPVGREPAFFAGSKLRPIFSAVGRRGWQSMPPDAAAYLDKLSRQRRT
jgi:membrane protein required for colicin V production